MDNFTPTLGEMIKRTDAILEDVPKSLYPRYAKVFKGTLTQEVIFSGSDFEEAASEYCRKAGWKEVR